MAEQEAVLVKRDTGYELGGAFDEPCRLLGSPAHEIVSDLMLEDPGRHAILDHGAPCYGPAAQAGERDHDGIAGRQVDAGAPREASGS